MQLLTTPLTPAEFALGEVRFKKQFHRLRPDEEGAGIPIDEYVELPVDQRHGRVPFLYATDDERHLIKVACSESIVALVEDRRRYWHTLQYLSGVHEGQLTSLHRSDLEELRAKYEQAMAQRESTLDDIARAMSELATASRAPAGVGGLGGGCRRPGRPPLPVLPRPLPSRARLPRARCGSTRPTSRCAPTAGRATRSFPSSSSR